MYYPKITVSIEFSPGEIKVVRRELSEMIVCDSLQPLDFPSPDADPFAAALCTGATTIRRVMKKRHEIAKMLSHNLTEALLDQMGAKDTEMGYE